MSDARVCALDTLLRVFGDDAYSKLALNGLIEEFGLDGRESALASRLVYGVIERKITLDYIISSFSKHGVNKLDPVVLNTLRLGVYQLLYMDKIPESAAVNESVKLVARRREYAKGYVNGVLRSVQRANADELLPRDGKRADILSVKYSAPKELIELWDKSYGEEKCEELLAASLCDRGITIRVNTLKTEVGELLETLRSEGISVSRHEAVPNALVLNGCGNVARLSCFKKGFFHVQDAASQLCAEALAPREGERVLDMCAAPGGKSFTAAQLMNDRGSIISCDVSESKLGLIKTEAERLGIKSISCMVNDGRVKNPELFGFDRVLCDAPCSGLGIISSKPEIKYNACERIAALCAIQHDILNCAAEYVRVGGRLVYSTCTLDPAENEEQTHRFLAEHRDFKPLNGDGVTVFIGENGMNGFYFAVLERTGTEGR